MAVSGKVTRTTRKKLPDLTIVRLWTRAGGRCEFCNDYLLVDSLTLKEANFGNIGHIVAVSRDGPRGDDPLPMERRNDIENLMLVCPIHHILIDSKEHVAEFPAEKLRMMKRDHEERIIGLTAVGPDQKTTVLRLRARFDADAVVDLIHQKQIEEAIAPKFMSDKEGIDIDLTGIAFTASPEFWSLTTNQIKEEVDRAFRPMLNGGGVRNVSVFAVAPVPLIVFLGNSLGSSIPTDFHQRHTDSSSWRWKEGSPPTDFTVTRLQTGSIGTAVLLISVSGRINIDLLPENVARMPIYEIAPSDGSPSRCWINTQEDLIRFKVAYQRVLGRMRDDDSALAAIHLFAAVPPAVAGVCGHDLLKKVHPTVHVYDFDKSTQRYVLATKVNDL